MKKKFISIFIILVMLINMIPVTFANAATPKVTVTVDADKTEAKRGEEITYTIKCKAPEGVCSIQLALDIPTGLTYVSGDIAQNLEDVIGDVTEASYTKSEKLILIAHYLPISLTEDVTLATFKCKVNDDANGEYSVGLKDVEFTDSDIETIPESGYSIVSDKTKVVIPVTGVKLNKSTTTINAGATETLVATVEPTEATNKKLTWSSSDVTVATVDANGVVNGLKIGNAKITVSTEDGKHSASCDVEVVCAHANKTTYPAVPSTCKVQGNEEYVTCDDCGKVISGSDAKLPLADHKYGTLITKVDPIHTSTQLEDGKEAHYKCSDCNKLFNESKKEATEEELIIKAPSHTYGDWEVDTTDHWKECGCGNIINKEAHKGGEATCIEKATCEVCGIKYGDLDIANHKETEVRDALEAGCDTEGYTGDTYCKDCDEKIEDGEKINPKGHEGGEATCTEKAICEECKKEYGDLDSDNHVNTEIRNAVKVTCTVDGYSGDKYCIACDKLLEKGTVIEAGHQGGEATCTKKAVCEMCEEEYGELNPDKHVNVELRGVVEATYEKEGYTGDAYCKDCDKLVEKGIATPVLEKPVVEEKPKVEADPLKPETNDNSNIILWVSLLVISGICFIVGLKWNAKEKIVKRSK